LNPDTDGQYLVMAESYTFQIGKNNDGLLVLQLYRRRILKNLIKAVDKMQQLQQLDLFEMINYYCRSNHHIFI
jgi:hypothetical protein